MKIFSFYLKRSGCPEYLW